MFDLENNVQEINYRMAEYIGKIINAISETGTNLHVTHSKEFCEYYKQICTNKDPELRYFAAFNLPCFYVLYKDHQ